MSLFDTFKGKQYKSELATLQKEHEDLKSLLTPEMQDAFMLQKKIESLQLQCSVEEEKISSLNQVLEQMNSDISVLNKTIAEKKEKIIWMDDEILVQEFGLYTPRYSFASAQDYKEELTEVRDRQKQLIKKQKAVTGDTNWRVNGSLSEGKKMVSNTQKLLLRAFNSECDELISKVKYTNFDVSLERIEKSAEAISKLGSIMGISISPKYLSSKEEELELAFEYQLQKEKEKEELKAARAEQREQAKIQKELDEQRRKIEKEQYHYQSAYKKLCLQLEQNPTDKDLQQKKSELESQLSDINKALDNIDYRQANMKAGYVYIISNIGAFGENIYKIGMTRRLDPQERIDELGDASVPFNFDVHAMIFSDDAPALESALHHAFENKKLNMVNQRREFFNVTLDEIKDVIKKNFDKTVEFIDVPDAEQYRISQKMKSK